MTTKPKQQTIAVGEPPSEPKWINEMHDHYRQNGFYRAQDLEKVLGNPRDHVAVRPSDEDPINFIVKK